MHFKRTGILYTVVYLKCDQKDSLQPLHFIHYLK